MPNRQAYVMNPLNDMESADWCRAAYQEARLASDSAIVDRHRIIFRRGADLKSVKCSDFRRAGKIR